MSKLEGLIQQYCPDGVEYVKLSKIAPPTRGVRVIKSQLVSRFGDGGGRTAIKQNVVSKLMVFFEKYLGSV